MQADRRREDVTLRAVVLSADRELVARLRETLFGVGGVELEGVASHEVEIAMLLDRVRPDLILVDPASLGAGMDALERGRAAPSAEGVWLTLAAEGGGGRPFVVGRPPSIDELRRTLAPLHARGTLVAPPRRRAAGPTGEDDDRAGRYLRRLLVRSPGHLRLLPVEEVLWIDAVHNAVKLHTLRGEFRLRQSITALLSALDPDRFVRIHRSTVVQLEAVREFHINAQGRYFAVMPGGTVLTVSRSYHDALLAKVREAGAAERGAAR